jgi:hypothetical protein
MEFPPSRRSRAARPAWFTDKLGAEAGKNKDFGPVLRATDSLLCLVMAGLVPAIHAYRFRIVDARHKSLPRT